MNITSHRWARVVASALIVSTLASCGLPRSGPSKREIYAGSVERDGNAFIVEANEAIAALTRVDPGLSFGSMFANAAVLGSDTVQPGDALSITVYENVEDGLLTAGGTSANINQVQVDGDGFIFVPYAGRIRAAGNSPERIRQILTERLEQQTPDPQVLVQRTAGDGATVSLIGGIGGQGVYPIERPTRTLTAMLARAGGVTISPETAQVTVTRGSTQGTVFLQDLYEQPGYDIALRNGDRILVDDDPRFFTALGATGSQAKVPFETQTISLVEALATVGGLNPGLADPKGVFIYRDESEHITERMTGLDLQGHQKVVYVFDLTKPMGMFTAREFQIRAEDTLYVSSAPFTDFQKASAAVTAPIGTFNAVNSVID